MTVHHEQVDVAFHTYPDGEVTLQLPVEAFGHDRDEAYLDGAAATSLRTPPS